MTHKVITKKPYMMLKNKKIITLPSLLICLIISAVVMVITIYLISPRNNGGVYFDSTISEADKQKITTDLEKVYKEDFNNGFRMEIKQVTYPSCTKVDGCTFFQVKYIYNKYGDNASGYLELENGVYVFHSNL